MAVIDVDTHWEIGASAPGEHPLEPWRHELPRGLDLLAFAIAGDLLHALPAEKRPAPAELLRAMVDRATEAGQTGPAIHPSHDSTPPERVAWMDQVGIDHCLVNPGGYWQQIPFTSDPAAAGAYANAWLAERLAPARDRLGFVAVIDMDDPATAVAELKRCRAAGARGFFLSTRHGRPAGNCPPGHPMFDPVWQAACRLGMVAVIHVGNTSADFAGWADLGWQHPDGSGLGGLVRLANSQRVHMVQNLLTSLLLGGVFARHPTLTVVIEECSAGWLPWYVRQMNRQCTDSPILGRWPYELSGGEMLRRNVRLTPLPGFGDDDALALLAELGEMIVFSSDYPHLEGNADPIGLYGEGLDHLDQTLRERFLGGSISECFARMGDPLG